MAKEGGVAEEVGTTERGSRRVEEVGATECRSRKGRSRRAPLHRRLRGARRPEGRYTFGHDCLFTSGRQLSHPRRRMAMAAEARRPIPTALSFILLIAVSLTSPAAATEAPPTPAPWPPQFHAVLFRNHSGSLALIDLWYDWPNGRNFNIIQDQLGAGLRYDLEWNNGTSFYFTLGASGGTCRTVHFDVGILRPDWLDGAQYLGRRRVDGFLCNVWQKADFIWYYEDAATRRPVRWVFYTGRSVDVMTFEVGAAMEDAKWQAPAYCFEKGEEKREPETQAELAGDAPGMLLLQRAEPEWKRFPGFLM